MKLAKGYTQEQFATILKQLVAPYVQLLSELHAAGAQIIQVDEPIFASLTKEEVQQAKEIYEAIRKEVPNANLLLQTYFDSVEENYEEIITFPVSNIGLDFIHGKEGNLHAISKYGFPADKTLAVGCIDTVTFGEPILMKFLRYLQRYKNKSKRKTSSFSLLVAYCIRQSIKQKKLTYRLSYLTRWHLQIKN